VIGVPTASGRLIPYNQLTCEAGGCDKKRRTRSYCHRHAELFRRNGNLEPKAPRRTLDDAYFPDGINRPGEPQKPFCVVEGCNKPSDVRSLCTKHYAKIQTSGTLKPLKRSHRDRRAASLWARYRLTPEDLSEILREQKNMCLVCAVPLTGDSKLDHIDHHHQSGWVRGVVHWHCNQLIGMVERHGVRLAEVAKNAVEWTKYGRYLHESQTHELFARDDPDDMFNDADRA
jgi:hypothetical protein